MKLYSIKPLEWEKNNPNYEDYISRVNSDYSIRFVEREDEEPHWEWEWYSEYGSEVHPCESLEDGKSKAQEDWNNRISQYLTEYKEEK